MLKFEGYSLGTEIRALDFQPCAGRLDSYVDGTVVGFQDIPYKAYIIAVTNDSEKGEWSRIGTKIMVPMESSHDFDERVTQLSTEAA